MSASIALIRNTKKVEKKFPRREGCSGPETFSGCEARKGFTAAGGHPDGDSPDKVGIPGAGHVPLTSWPAPLYWLPASGRRVFEREK